MAETWSAPALDDVSTDEFVTAAQISTLGNNERYLVPVFYDDFTAPVNVTSNTSTAPDTIITATSITYEAVPHWFEFFCPVVVGINANISYLQLTDGTTELMRIWGEARATNGLTYGVFVRALYTPTAAAHTFSITGYNSSAVTVTYTAGAGGSSTTNAPGHFCITRAIPATNP